MTTGAHQKLRTRLFKIATPMFKENHRQGPKTKYGQGSLLRHVSEDDDTARIERKVLSSRDRPKITDAAKGIAVAGAGLQPPRLLQSLRLSDPLPPGTIYYKYIRLRPTHKKTGHVRWSGLALDWVWKDRCIQNLI